MMKKLLGLGIPALVWTLAATAAAQPSFTGVTDVVGYTFDQFGGQGYAPAADPADGQLDSDAWRVLGMSEGDTTFGGTHDTVTSDFARTTSEGGTATGGVYAFDVDNTPVTGMTNYALGVQPTGSDFTPGSHQLRILNSTGGDIRALEVVYEIHHFNDQNRSTSVDLRVIRASDSAEIAVSSVSFTTPETAAVAATWMQVDRSAVIDLDSMPISDGDYLILSWDMDDVAGSGSRDEIALDDVIVGIPTCGNGVADTGETCDDGDIVTETECPYGMTSCTLCNADCSAVLTLSGSACGDGTVDTDDGEACDDGNTVSETECAYGTMSCTACSDDCSAELSLTGSYCGDGTTDSGDGEACDDGNTVSETECAYGTMTCTGCSDDCSSELSLTGSYCGDGTVDAGDGEECDDGNTTAGDGCSDTCTTEAATDAGVPDAGPADAGPSDAGAGDAGAGDGGVDLDAGTPDEDAGAVEDAGAEADGGEMVDGATGADAGSTTRDDDGGCSCSAPGASPTGPAMGLLVLVGLGLLLRRRRD